MERLRRKCAMLGLLDRATKLTSSQAETPRLKLQALPAGAIASSHRASSQPIVNCRSRLRARYELLKDRLSPKVAITLCSDSPGRSSRLGALAVNLATACCKIRTYGRKLSRITSLSPSAST